MYLNGFQHLDEWMRAVSRVPAAQLQSLQAIATPTGQIVSETTLVTAEVRVCLKLFSTQVGKNHGL